KAVDGLDVEIDDGEIVSLVGPNGAGKTTVFNLISGVLRATAGSIRLLDRELVGLPAHRITHHGVARTFQNIRVFPQLTVRENILLGTHHWTRSGMLDRKSTRLNSSHLVTSYAVFCLKK